MLKSNLHPKLIQTIEVMLLNSRVNLPYYGEFNLHVNYQEKRNDPAIKTAGVNVTAKGMNHYYNPDFIDSLTQEQVNFLVLHETFHLLFNHPKRTRMGGYDHKLSNIAQDMIINTTLVQAINPSFIDIPKDKYGRNNGLFLPKDYEQEEVFEILYDWLKTKKEDWEKRREKKEDEKIFNELHMKAQRPFPSELAKTFQGQGSMFKDSLIEKSATEYSKYIRNFARRVIVSLENQMPVELIGHTSEPVPNGQNSDTYNQELSERRAELFKNAIIENIDEYMDNYALCLAIFKDEKDNLLEQDKIDFILKYEEISNATIRKQRIEELKATKEGQQAPTFETLFQTYRFTELNKLDESTLKTMIQAKKLQTPNVAQEKAKYIGLAQNMLNTSGKGDTEKIIMNEHNDEPSVLRNDIAKKSQYAHFVNIKDSDVKQEINRRVEYKFDESFDDGMGGGSSPDSDNNDSQGGYGANGKGGQECYDVDDIFDNMEENDGQFMDTHIPDDVPEELREQMVKDVHERLKARGFSSGDVEQVLEKLRKKRKDYLKEIKRGISFIKGSLKYKTITRPSRRGIKGLKGNKKYGSIINVILDTSGSMGGFFNKALGFIFRSDIEINLIMVDTSVKSVEKIKSMSELQKVVIKGLGGTVLQPAVDKVVEDFSKHNTLILTDGYTDTLDFSSYNGKVLVISNGCEVPYTGTSRIKQIIVEDND